MRLFFIDNIRLVLTVLVVLHHVALTYGGSSGWYYYESSGDPLTSTVLTIFLAMNRTFFLGIFFMVSGYFTPGSFDRKGADRFLGDRLVRLGIPLVFFSYFIRPTIVYTMDPGPLREEYSFWANILEFRNVAPGPLWFVEVLLIFSGAYALWRLAGRLFGFGSGRKAGEGFPGTASIVGFVLVISVITFLIRIYYPPSRQFFHLRIGNYAQYVGFYIVGILACGRDWVTAVTGEVGRRWTLIGVLSILLYGSLTYYGLKTGTPASFTGGLHWSSLLGAVVENFLCMGMMIGLVYLFKKDWNYQGKLTAAMAGDAYAVYVLHAPIIVYFTCLIKPVLTGYPLTKFGFAAIVGTSLCFVICHWIRKVPLVKRVL